MPMKLDEGFTLGCDPELFILDKEGKLVSAEGLIPGTKLEPFPVNFGAVQVDGMAAEFNIDPVDNYADWDRNIRAVMDQLKDLLPEGYSFHVVPSVTFDKDVFDAAPAVAKELGCTPDFNAWTNEVNPVPDTSKTPYLRTASGHIHVGWTNNKAENDAEHIGHCRDLVKQLDWFLGGWSLRIDKDVTRRALYGKAGACRYKPYGVEYRVLSNFWINSRDRRQFVWDRTCLAIREMRRNNLPEQKPELNEALVKFINTGVRAKELSNCHYPLISTDPVYLDRLEVEPEEGPVLMRQDAAVPEWAQVVAVRPPGDRLRNPNFLNFAQRRGN